MQSAATAEQSIPRALDVRLPGSDTQSILSLPHGSTTSSSTSDQSYTPGPGTQQGGVDSRKFVLREDTKSGRTLRPLMTALQFIKRDESQDSDFDQAHATREEKDATRTARGVAGQAAQGATGRPTRGVAGHSAQGKARVVAQAVALRVASDDDSESVISLSLAPYVGAENVVCELVPDIDDELINESN